MPFFISYCVIDYINDINISDEFGPPRTPTGYHGARNGYRHAIQTSHNAIGPHRQNNNMDGHEAIEMNAWSPRSRIPPTSSQLDSMEGFFLEVCNNSATTHHMHDQANGISFGICSKGGYIER